MKLRLTEHTDILPGIRKRKGSVVQNLPADRIRQLFIDNKAEPVDFEAIPKAFPVRKKLIDAGYLCMEAINEAIDEELLDIEGIGSSTLKDIREFNTNTKNKEATKNG